MLLETATLVATASIAAYGYKKLYDMITQAPEHGGQPWTKGELPDAVKLEYLTEAEIQRIQYIQTQEKYFQAVQTEGFPREELAKGLFTMAVLIIPRTDYVNLEINFLTKLQKSGMIDVSAIEPIKQEIEEIQSEISAIRQEAARLRPGWEGSIFQEAMEFREQQKKQAEQHAMQMMQQQMMAQKAAAQKATQQTTDQSSDDEDLPSLVAHDGNMSDPEL
eukprot:comp12870_c0_seq1/m.8048 comp12870_c0_seq1/g.8048  ORF comp12870_c0_seq1/g.8048 comp12870_c0_seq1/m.8048 type:complete len:220 (-) comp12870_c0_seq1:489-1148(-)